jgi:translation initiation factor 2B subunit (eIF-2B alpha/beta/delta family)
MVQEKLGTLYRDKAIDDPSPDKVAAYYDLQRVMMDKAQRFADMARREAANVLPDRVQSDMKMSTISFSKGVTDVFGALTNSSSGGLIHNPT